MKKMKLLILVIIIMLIPPSKTVMVEAADNEISSIYCGELPTDGSPLILEYYRNCLDERLNGRNYIIFTITKTSVTWTCVDVPANWAFRGEMSILDLTSGLYSGQNMTMSGRMGSIGYYGLPGHTYRMNFNGLFYLVDSSGKIISLVSSEYESGSWSWKVPFD